MNADANHRRGVFGLPSAEVLLEDGGRVAGVLAIPAAAVVGGDVMAVLEYAGHLLDAAPEFWPAAHRNARPLDLMLEVHHPALFPTGLTAASGPTLRAVEAWAKSRRVKHAVRTIPAGAYGLERIPCVLLRWGHG